MGGELIIKVGSLQSVVPALAAEVISLRPKSMLMLVLKCDASAISGPDAVRTATIDRKTERMCQCRELIGCGLCRTTTDLYTQRPAHEEEREPK